MSYLSKFKYIYRGMLPPTFNRCLGRMFTFGGYDSCREEWSFISRFQREQQKLSYFFIPEII